MHFCDLNYFFYDFPQQNFESIYTLFCSSASDPATGNHSSECDYSIMNATLS